MSEPRSVTLLTTDRGAVTIPEPSWCVGHEGDPVGLRDDILHRGRPVAFTFRGQEITDACIVQTPCATLEVAELNSRTPGVSVSAIARTLDARAVYELAAAFDAYADRLRDLADQLLVIVAEGDL